MVTTLFQRLGIFLFLIEIFGTTHAKLQAPTDTQS